METSTLADHFFSPQQQYDYYGRRVAYDGRIINNIAPRVSNNQLSMPLQRSEEPSYGMYQLIDFNSNLANCQ